MLKIFELKGTLLEKPDYSDLKIGKSLLSDIIYKLKGSGYIGQKVHVAVYVESETKKMELKQ